MPCPCALWVRPAGFPLDAAAGGRQNFSPKEDQRLSFSVQWRDHLVRLSPPDDAALAAFVEHFVPVRDSMGEVAAVLEVFIAAGAGR
jgi:hypothetical protein